MTFINGWNLRHLRGDIYGGVVAAVVALPLALAFGVTSGAGPIAGLYGAIFVGFFAALLGGTPSQISGPTGPMTVVMATVFLSYPGQPELAFTTVIMGGLIQILFGVLRIGSLISLVPFTVVSGFMSGIGVIIIILQIAPFFGHAQPAGGVIGSLTALPGVFADIEWDAAAVAAGVLAIVVLTPARFSRIVPSTLVALILGSLAVLYIFPQATVLGDIPTGFPELLLPAITLADFPGMIGWALILALLGTIDSLLTSLIADSVTRTHHQSNRELFGQGIGNMIAGLFGGIPGAGATMRTLVNVRTGGRTPLSGMIHALVLLAIVLGLGPLASHIPHAVLAGILIKVGIDIIDWPYLKRVPRAPRSGVAIMLAVLGLTVFVDLIIAFAAGMVASSLLLLKRMTDLQLSSVRSVGSATSSDSAEAGGVPLTQGEQSLLDGAGGSVILYHFAGPVTFGAAKGIARKLVLDADHRALVLDLTDVPLIDTTGAFAIDEVVENAQAIGAAVYLVGMRPPVANVLRRLDVLKRLADGHICAQRLEAIQKAVNELDAG
jgi:SulP family sulfate permease